MMLVSGTAAPTHRATLTVHLVENVSVGDLVALLGGLERAYLEGFDAQGGSADLALDEKRQLRSRYEMLWIEKLEIGTPNVVKLVGSPRQIAVTATLLGTILAVPVAVSEIYKNVAEGMLATTQREAVLTERHGVATDFTQPPPFADLRRGASIVSPTRPPEIDLEPIGGHGRFGLSPSR